MFVSEDFDHQYDIISNRPTLYENKINCFLSSSNDLVITPELWKYYSEEFNWLINHKGTLQCRTCQEAHKKYPLQIENDGWVSINKFSCQKYDKDSLLLILKVHNYSENHVKATEILKNNINLVTKFSNGFTHFKPLSPKPIVSTPSIVSVQSNATNIQPKPILSTVTYPNNLGHTPIQQIPKLSQVNNMKIQPKSLPTYNPWLKYMDIYRWLSVTPLNNPACRMCQQAALVSPKMFRTKWTHPDTNMTHTITYDRPQRTLIQHHHSTNHRLAEDILGENCRLKEFAADHKPPSCFSDVPLNMFTQDAWEKYLEKYPWLYFSQNQSSFHCVYCEKAYSQYPSRMKATVWTNTIDARESVYDKSRARKLLNDHQRSFNHNVAEELLRCGGNSKLSYPHHQPKPINGDIDEDRIDYHSDSSAANTEVNGHNNNNKDNSSELNNDLYFNTSGSLYNQSFPDETIRKIEDDQWQRLSDKYRWLTGINGVQYGCRACQRAYTKQPDAVPLNNWTRGAIPFTCRSTYMHLRKKFYQHNCCTKHRACVAMLANNNSNNNNINHTNNRHYNIQSHQLHQSSQMMTTSEASDMSAGITMGNNEHFTSARDVTTISPPPLLFKSGNDMFIYNNNDDNNNNRHMTSNINGCKDDGTPCTSSPGAVEPKSDFNDDIESNINTNSFLNSNSIISQRDSIFTTINNEYV